MNTGPIPGLLKPIGRNFYIAVSCVVICTFAISAFAVPSDQQASTLQSKVDNPYKESSQLSNERLTLKGRLKVGTEGLFDEKTEGVSAAYGGDLLLNYQFTDYLNLYTESRFRFANERFQAYYGADEFSDGISSKRFELVFKPNSYFEAGAGGVNQKSFLRTPLLISNRAFPGAYVQGNLGTKMNGVQLRTGYYIPTSRSFDIDRQEKEELPGFSTAILVGYLTPNKHFQIRPHAMTYKYTHLPATVAYDSEIKGNSVNPGATQSNASYIYDYQGYLFGLDLEVVPTNKMKFILSGQAVENTKAPETLNSGQIITLGSEFYLGSVRFKPAIGAFYNEADASVASYNTGELGHNDREGNFYELDIDFTKYKFGLRTGLTQANVINSDEYGQTSDQTYYYVMLETFYVQF